MYNTKKTSQVEMLQHSNSLQLSYNHDHVPSHDNDIHYMTRSTVFII